MGLLFFSLFGLSGEAFTKYCAAGRWVARLIGIPCRDAVEPSDDSIVFAHASRVVVTNSGILGTISSNVNAREIETDIFPPEKAHTRSSSFVDESKSSQAEVEVEDKYPLSPDEERDTGGYGQAAARLNPVVGLVDAV